MKKSIRFNLFVIFAVMMVAFVVCGILLNVFMLEKYYILKNKAIFNSVSAEVVTALSNGDDVQRIIEEIDRSDGISVTIANRNMINEHTSFPQKKDNNHLPKEIEELIKGSNKNIKKSPAYSTIEKQDALQPKLAYVIMTDGDQYVVLTKPMKGIRESVVMANQFYVMAGAVALLFGSLFMFRFSNKVTKPIIEMSEVAQDISELKFGRKLRVKSDDELSILARSINTLSDKLEASIEGLKSDIEFQKSLSRNMSHELKTPIGVIKGYAEGILFGVADNPEMLEKYLKTITGECDRMDELVKEMLILSRLSAKDYALSDVTEFDSKSVVGDILERFESHIKNGGINFVVDCCHNIKITANYDLLLRAISNLISNAFKYCDENKYVRLDISEGDQVEIRVFNTCTGIPKNEQSKIFDEFYKIDKSRSREGGGHGLGLSIVKSIAFLHKGNIEVHNTKGGVEFILTLPKTL